MISDTSENGAARNASPSQPGRRRPVVGAARPAPAALYSSGEALTRIGHDLPYSVLHRWVRNHAVTPTRPATGKGSDIGWTPHDIAALTATARVRQDLDRIGLPCPWKLVRELWDQLDTTDTAEIVSGTVHIYIHLGLENT